MKKTKMFIARLPCGCLASADLYPDDPEAERIVIEWLNEGFIVRMEYRKFGWAQKCLRHEITLLAKQPTCIYWHFKNWLKRVKA